MGGDKEHKSMSGWMDVFGKIYDVPDSKRSPEQMWMAVMSHCSTIGEAIRKISFPELLVASSHAFCWISSFVRRCNDICKDGEGENKIFSFDGCLSDMVSLKYPRICGHCLKPTCVCQAEEMDKKKDKAARYEELLNARKDLVDRGMSFRSYRISQWQQDFKTMYGSAVHISTLETIGFHFLEEVGEVALAIRQLSQIKRIHMANEPIEGIDADFLKGLSTLEGIVDNYAKYCRNHAQDGYYSSRDVNVLKARIVEAKMGMVIEIADMFSWFCSILNKINSILEENQMELDISNLEDQLRKEYIDENDEGRCPTCIRNQCSCVFFP